MKNSILLDRTALIGCRQKILQARMLIFALWKAIFFRGRVGEARSGSCFGIRNISGCGLLCGRAVPGTWKAKKVLDCVFFSPYSVSFYNKCSSMQSVCCVVLLSAFRPARWVICPEWVELKKSENDAENKLFSLGSELALCGVYLIVLWWENLVFKLLLERR